MKFKNLHQQDTPLLIANVWDVPSAKIAEKLNFKTIGTSSAAIASLLGYPDGEQLTFSELEYLVQKIASYTHLPLSVDLESGYSRKPKEITDHIKRLARIGVVGINIEDSIADQSRTLLDAQEFSKTITEVTELLNKEHIDIFINVRTDTFVVDHPNALEETKKRIRLYEKAGADGIFVPCLVEISDIKEIVDSTHLPVNVMCMPNLPDFTILQQTGIKRISMGNFLFDHMYEQLKQTMTGILQQQSFKSIF